MPSFIGGLPATYITGQSLVAGKSTQTHGNATCRAFILFRWIRMGRWDRAHSSTDKKTQPFQEKLLDKQKKAGVQSAGPARMGGYAEKRRIIKYEWEWAVLTCKLRASVCHRCRADAKAERWFLLHTQVQTRPTGLVLVIDLVMGGGWWGWSWKKGDKSRPGHQTGLLDAYQETSSHQTQADGADERLR